MTDVRPAAVVVLAAGEGTRMRSAVPKVLHKLAGRTMLGHAIAAAGALDPNDLVVVVRHERELVAAHVAEIAPRARLATQDEIPGTGRAVQCAMDVLDVEVSGAVVVMAGDIPMLDSGTLDELVAAHVADANAVTVLTTVVADPTGYGRIVREPGSGDVLGIVEHRDADDEQRAIAEINSSVYVFDAQVLRSALGRLGRDNAQGEVYLTDVLALARADGGAVRALQVDDAMLVEGVNDRVALARLGAEMNRRILTEWMLEGVTVVDPATTWVDVDVELAADVTLLPGCHLQGATSVAGGAVIGPDTTLVDAEVGPGAQVVRSQVHLAKVGPDAVVGPFSYLRPGTDLGEGGKIGAYVETKAATIGAHSKVPHLSYVGDAVVGEYSNVGAGTIVANYDGVAKHRTVVGDHARVGSQSVLVAPVTVADGAYTGAGTVVRYDVPPGALAVGPSGYRIFDGWVLEHREGTGSAAAAREALADGESAAASRTDDKFTSDEGHPR